MGAVKIDKKGWITEINTNIANFNKQWKKHGKSPYIVTQALEAMALQDKTLSREQKITLKNQSINTILAKQTIDALGWEWDPTKSREEQIKGQAI